MKQSEIIIFSFYVSKERNKLNIWKIIFYAYWHSFYLLHRYWWCITEQLTWMQAPYSQAYFARGSIRAISVTPGSRLILPLREFQKPLSWHLSQMQAVLGIRNFDQSTLTYFLLQNCIFLKIKFLKCYAWLAPKRIFRLLSVIIVHCNFRWDLANRIYAVSPKALIPLARLVQMANRIGDFGGNAQRWVDMSTCFPNTRVTAARHS